MAAEMASVEIEHDIGGLVDHLRSYKVVIDGEVAGQVRFGESWHFEVAPGSHEIFLKMDWVRSERVNVHLTAGQTAIFRCATRVNFFIPFSMFYWITFGRNRYIELTQVTA